MQSWECPTGVTGQLAEIMASTFRLPASTSMASVVTPRPWTAVISSRIRAAPTPRPCQASATTMPTSGAGVAPQPWAVSGPHGSGGGAASAAMACPMMTPSRTATTASTSPGSPHSSRSRAGFGVTGAKNLR